MAQKNGFRGKSRQSPYNIHGSESWRERQKDVELKREQDGELRNDSYSVGVIGEGRSNMSDSPKEKGRREKKFGNRARLYVGNLPRSLTEDELRKLFEPHGETDQIFIEKEKNFGFVRMAYKSEGERAIAALNGEEIKGRELRVRFAASSCSVKVNNLHPTISNEYLTQAFSTFGEVECATVVTDDRGKSLGYGIIDFAKKVNAVNAMERCRNGCFILTKSPMPVTLTEFSRENEEGLPEKQIQQNSAYKFERDAFPRMAQPGTPEFEYAMRWKGLYENEKGRRDELEAMLADNRKQLEAEMEQFRHHEHANFLRIQLVEHQREQMILQERIRQHEQFFKAVGGNQMPPGHPPILPPPNIPGGPPNLSGMPPPIPPQPLLQDRMPEDPSDAMMPPNSGQGPFGPLLGAAAMLPPRGAPLPPFLLPSPMRQQFPPP